MYPFCAPEVVYLPSPSGKIPLAYWVLPVGITAVEALLADGINFFEDSRCDSPSVELSMLAGKGFLIDPAAKAHIPGAVASFLPDEWDTFLPGNLTADQAAKLVPYRPPGPRFLTLTNHFYSHAAPLPQGRGMYPALIQNADVLGFDLYPLQNWCRYDDFGHVFEAQKELVQLSGGKPTYQWIEARGMDCHDPSLNPTPASLRLPQTADSHQHRLPSNP